MDTSQTPHLKHQVVRAFKIWYSDGTYTGKTYKDWTNAPKEDVQFVMVYFRVEDPEGRPTRLYSTGCDYYAMNKNMVFTSSFDDKDAVEGHILYGKFMNYDKYMAMEQEVFNDYGEGWLYKPKTIPERKRVVKRHKTDG